MTRNYFVADAESIRQFTKDLKQSQEGLSDRGLYVFRGNCDGVQVEILKQRSGYFGHISCYGDGAEEILGKFFATTYATRISNVPSWRKIMSMAKAW